MKGFELVKEYLDHHIVEHIPRYLFLREIEGKHEDDGECIKLHEKLMESKWYKQLEEEMLEDGSFGRFHSMDSKDKTKRVFRTTEEAVRRMKDLGLPTYDLLVVKVCTIMRKYLSGEAHWSDRIEKHFGFEIALNSMVGANLALLNDELEEVKRYKKLCAYYLEAAFTDSDELKMDIWDKLNRDNCDFLLAPKTIHILWLLHKNPYISDTTLRKFLDILWMNSDGIYYLYGNRAISECIQIEDKNFMGWLYALEHISRVGLNDYPVREEVRIHLLKQVLKLINYECGIPKSNQVFGHYHASWRKEELCRCDMVLRIARVISRLL